MHGLDHRPDMLGADVGMYAVAKVEHVTRAVAEIGEDLCNFGAYGLGGGVQGDGVEVALQRNPVAYAAAGLGDGGLPIQAQGVVATFRHGF